MSQGKVVQIIGAVVDVEFPRDSVPKVYDALKVEGTAITLEVQQQLGDGVVRTIALGSSDGLRRGLMVNNTGAPITVPVGKVSPEAERLMRDSAFAKFGSPSAFGHYGAGGSVGFADHEHGIGFRSLTEAIDTTTASGRLIMHVMGAIAEFERQLISERGKAGMRAAMERGKRVGRPVGLDLKKAREMLKKGMRVEDVAQRLGVSEPTIYYHFPTKVLVRWRKQKR